ncbi:MAG TPA: SCO family protein [Planctomycetaceae bacterium]|nr:SCO family protein [Planctomycetaceae bacterium]
MNLKTCIIVALSLVLTTGAQARAQLLTGLPANAQGIDVEDRVGDSIPLGLKFKNERGRTVTLSKYFEQGKPIVLTLNYSDCPGLCIAQLENLTSTLKQINGGGIGEDFEIITVSIDPSESHTKAARTKQKYTELLSGTKAQEGWHFLTGDAKNIRQLADEVGFRYTYDVANKRFNHAAATYFVSEKGQICRYLLSLGVEPDQFKLALAEARQGIIGKTWADTVIQLCYLYDPDANRYTASARRIMAFGGAAFALLLTGFTAPFWFSKKRAANDPADSAESVSGDLPGPDAIKQPPDGD